MHAHTRSCLEGPVSQTRQWWRNLDLGENPLTSNKKEPMFCAALVEQIRREIAEGAYDTPQKWDIALDRLLDRLEADDV